MRKSLYITLNYFLHLVTSFDYVFLLCVITYKIPCRCKKNTDSSRKTKRFNTVWRTPVVFFRRVFGLRFLLFLYTCETLRTPWKGVTTHWITLLLRSTMNTCVFYLNYYLYTSTVGKCQIWNNNLILFFKKKMI